ncbi:uncharacterized protein KGF55_005251 [Candida pseudojiufengensis]|uniref:uncharacterized protein n=1 Tax=Candida pseudojiufengensis TaxID=497109 RepID=UPI002224D8EE|nr:uncharacterized protein KGF55_005251 [Candida pseudojiufengensis]KAI5959607.1 hypothetical protein KGF55_005251 [Candida pseudojiufengensis]
MMINTIKRQNLSIVKAPTFRRALSQSSIFYQQQQNQQRSKDFGFNYFKNDFNNQINTPEMFQNKHQLDLQHIKNENNNPDNAYQFNELRYVDLVHPHIAEFADLF